MVSDEAQKFLDALREYLGIIGPVAGGAVGYLAGRRKIAAEANKLEIEADVAQLDAVTRRFQALIDGYETQARNDRSRIDDLTREVMQLRDEIKSLRKALDERPRPV